MHVRLRHILILALLALYGPMAVCGPGSHALAAPSTPAGTDGCAPSSAIRADLPCPICDFHLLGQLPSASPPTALEPLVIGRVALKHLPGIGRPHRATARPRAPPRSRIAHGPRD